MVGGGGARAPKHMFRLCDSITGSGWCGWFAAWFAYWFDGWLAAFVGCPTLIRMTHTHTAATQHPKIGMLRAFVWVPIILKNHYTSVTLTRFLDIGWHL